MQDVFDTAPVERFALDDFRLDMRGAHLGRLVLTEVRSSAQRFERERRMVATGGIDHFLAQLYTTGGYAGLADEADIRVRAGDICILDLTRTLSTRAGSFSNVTLVVPRPLLAAAVTDVDRLHGMVLERDRAVTRMLSAHVTALAGQAARFSPGDGDIVSAATVALIARSLDGKAAGSVDRVPIAASPLRRALAHIKQNLHDPALGPALLADRFGLSRATLYRMFEPMGGVAELIRNRRLTAAAIELASGKGRRVSEIARHWGFADDSNFSRAFRLHFGIAPRDAREQSVAIWDQIRAGDDDARFAYWLRTLRR